MWKNVENMLNCTLKAFLFVFLQLKLLQTPINNNWLGAHCAYIASGGLPSTTSVDDGQSPLAIPGPSGVNVPGAEPQRARPKENDQQTQQQVNYLQHIVVSSLHVYLYFFTCNYSAQEIILI